MVAARLSPKAPRPKNNINNIGIVIIHGRLKKNMMSTIHTATPMLAMSCLNIDEQGVCPAPWGALIIMPDLIP
jgi:hypothetical protein